MEVFNGRWLVLLTIVLALALSVFPLSPSLQWARPEWVAMVLLFWVIALPDRVGISICWLVGLVQDVVDGSVLGQHALSYAVLAYLALILYQRLRMFTLLQQAAVVFVLIGLNQLLSNWVQTLTGTVSPNLLYLLPAVVSALLWPLLSVLLRGLQREYRVG